MLNFNVIVISEEELLELENTTLETLEKELFGVLVC